MSEREGPKPWAKEGQGIRLTVRVTPRASRSEITGVNRGPDGRAVLAVRLASPPVDGAANAELLRLIAKRLGIAGSAIQLRSGQGGRLKILDVRGDPDDLLNRAAELCQ